MRTEIRGIGPFFKQFDYLESIDSTNEYLKTFVGHGEPRMVVAREQTAGKGRYSRKWHSPSGEGLYVSYLLYPEWRVDQSPFLEILAGLAVVRTISKNAPSNLPLRLKRPNDVYISGKKVCGVLTETSTLQDQILWAIVGIGVNLYQTEFPGDLSQKATSLAAEGLSVEHPLDFCEILTQEFQRLYGELVDGSGESLQKDFENLL
jgi:BirA family biotin operon repressor/biotin-[acetyl-CoA-carboxylase] ligase